MPSVWRSSRCALKLHPSSQLGRPPPPVELQRLGHPHVQATTGGAAQAFNLGTPFAGDGTGDPARMGKWKLYDEKYILPPSLGTKLYDSKKPPEWMQSLKDYLAGRCEEIDGVLNWAELQTEAITVESMAKKQNLPMLNECPNMKELSRQLWALLNPLIADSKVQATFDNVPRHNGLEAWRQLAEPINEDKQLVVKDLLPLVTNPKGATNMRS